ncbi:MAG: FAD:protein FMN transferase [Myxococcales bacterium]|nr:FAD:protein FMN transferase [Myxococcales bacterium]
MNASLTFAATGTEWSVASDVSGALEGAESFVRAAERRLSRFLPDSSLSRLNRERTTDDPMLAEVVRAALDMRDLTGGAFDPTLGARLAELGYDRTFEAIDSRESAREYRPSSLVVTTDEANVRLEGQGELDLGGIAKGWIVDRVVDMLVAAGARNVIVDGGGDIRVHGERCPIEYASGHVVHVESGAIATSSIRRRRWSDASGRALHHVLDPRTGAPVKPPMHTVTICASETVMADALATAALVDAERVFALLPSLEARAAACDEAGKWWTTRNWEELR